MWLGLVGFIEEKVKGLSLWFSTSNRTSSCQIQQFYTRLSTNNLLLFFEERLIELSAKCAVRGEYYLLARVLFRFFLIMLSGSFLLVVPWREYSRFKIRTWIFSKHSKLHWQLNYNLSSKSSSSFMLRLKKIKISADSFVFVTQTSCSK